MPQLTLSRHELDDADRLEDTDEPGEPGLIFHRPLEDRSFEVVETGIAVAAGLAIGTAVAGPIGTAVGGLVGIAAGLMAGEAVERAAGPAATTTDAERFSTPKSTE